MNSALQPVIVSHFHKAQEVSGLPAGFQRAVEPDAVSLRRPRWRSLDSYAEMVMSAPANRMRAYSMSERVERKPTSSVSGVVRKRHPGTGFRSAASSLRS